MTGTDHALTGAIIGASISHPLVAVPLAFLSHFVLDSLPHYGKDADGISRRTKLMWLLDLIVVPSLVLVIFFSDIDQKYLIIASIVAAVSPDFVWVYRLIVKEKLGKFPPGPKNKFNQFHSNIQKYEFQNGVYIEAVVTLLLLWALFGQVL